MNKLNINHIEDLSRSGISEEVAFQMGLRSGTEAEINLLLGRNDITSPGLIFNFFDIEGRQVEHGGRSFVRIKPDDDSKGKYLTAQGEAQEPFIPLGTKERLATHPYLILTEGEKKAIAASIHGFACIGLAGMWGWGKNKKLSPQLESLFVPGMKVVIVWDSDALLNSDFLRGTSALLKELGRKGCQVKSIVLPKGSTEKSGLDDFLLEAGKAEFERLVEKTKFTKPSATPDELLAEWCTNATWLSNLSPDKAREVLTSLMKKKFIDSFLDEQRETALKILDQHTGGIATQVFDQLVNSFVEEKYKSVPDSNQVFRVVKALTRYQTTFGQKMIVTKIDNPNRLVWCLPKINAVGSLPVPFRSLVSAVPKLGDPGDIADAYLEETFGSLKVDEIGLRHYNGNFYSSVDGLYKKITEEELISSITSFLNRTKIIATLDLMANVLLNLKTKERIFVPSEVKAPFTIEGVGKYKSLEDVIPMTNGYLVLEDLQADKFQLREYQNNTFFDRHHPVNFDLNAKCPVWLNDFLTKVQPDHEVRAFLQEIMGFFLLPIANLEKFFVFSGYGSNGKTTLTNILCEMLGKDYWCTVSLSKLDARFLNHLLTYAHLNLIDEKTHSVNQNERNMEEEQLKKITSGQVIQVEKKNKDFFEGPATARVLITTNQIPSFSDRSNGMYRRLIIVPWNVQVSDKEQNLNLSKELAQNELPGIFNWALIGLLRLLERGRLVIPEVCRRAAEEHRKTCASELGFIEDNFEAGDGFVPKEWILNRYRYHTNMYSLPKLSSQNLKKQFIQKFPGMKEERVRVDKSQIEKWNITSNRPYVFQGIVLKADSDFSSESQKEVA